ncbi:DUF4272 domain-containing protein [Variovorax sp. KBW07]|uniref:DUF4272 domain-containing protein n=1 Tax=Variovorax sp. KBW07 TaxID=2153358 RepID=UPI001C8A99A0|nr:DUF4272 domain-containing protein [Variovorax sp. KBW07]
MNLLRRWWDRQNERDAFKKGMAAFSRHCADVVKHHVPDATSVRTRAIWYGDQTRSRVVWTDASGRKWQWPLYFAFNACLRKPAERDAIVLRSLQAVLNPPQPQDEDDAEEELWVPRTAEQVAQRLLALIAVVWRANASEEIAQQGIAWAREHGIDAFLSPQELRFVFNAQRPPQQDLVNFGWRAEAMLPMAWALGAIPTLPPSHRRADIWKIPLVQQARQSPADFIASASLRPDGEVSDEEHRLLDEHWHVRDAQLRRQPIPSGLDAGIVLERRYALSWMVGYGKNWDEVPTDT